MRSQNAVPTLYRCSGWKTCAGKNPAHSGSVYYNYKEFVSIILLAVVDSEYRFIFVDIGANGKDSDSTIFKETKFWSNLIDGSLPLPKPKPLGTIVSESVPYVLLGDEGFGIHTNLMRPFAGTPHSITKRVFNYRHCRGRRYNECAFGILSNKWRIFHRPINVNEELAKKIIKTCCVLHNIVRVRDGYNFEDTLTVVGLEDVNHAVIKRGKNIVKMSGIYLQDTSSVMREVYLGKTKWCETHGQ